MVWTVTPVLVRGGWKGWKRKSLGNEPAPFWSPVLTPSTRRGMRPTSAHSQLAFTRMAQLSKPEGGTEGCRHRGRENKDGAALFSYTEEKSPLPVCYCKTIPLQPACLRSGNVALAPTLLLDLKVWIHVPAAGLRKRFSFKAESTEAFRVV